MWIARGWRRDISPDAHRCGGETRQASEGELPNTCAGRIQIEHQRRLRSVPFHVDDEPPPREIDHAHPSRIRRNDELALLASAEPPQVDGGPRGVLGHERQAGSVSGQPA
ncbi:MAG: hypothetical protein OEV40_30695, partial [Acidimicrobiia bacterium]|nr:hypothetical protein [Acidimicrobiia bacterium]